MASFKRGDLVVIQPHIAHEIFGDDNTAELIQNIGIGIVLRAWDFMEDNGAWTRWVNVRWSTLNYTQTLAEHQVLLLSDFAKSFLPKKGDRDGNIGD